MRQISLLGATGSVGRSATDVILAHRDSFFVEAVVGGRDAVALALTARKLNARFAALADGTQLDALREALSGTGIACGAGEASVSEAVDRPADVVIAAIAGTAGLRPTHAALRKGRRIALANKESLVCAGQSFMADARRIGADISAVDSEHNALQQALASGERQDVTVATLTASGGPFRIWDKQRIANASAAEASAHPVWAMGAKILIDSATLMNKGLELIEAHHLFGLSPEKLDVVVHPDAIIHAMVQWRDGAVTAGLAAPDMKIPIANALAFERRLEMPFPKLDLATIGQLRFERVDEDRFPCLGLARAAMLAGGIMPIALNAANEVAVAAFMAGRIGFYGIFSLVSEVCNAYSGRGMPPDSVDEALAVHEEALKIAEQKLVTLTTRS